MTRRKDDLFGQSDNVKVGPQQAVISLDRVQQEVQVLGAPRPSRGGMLPARAPLRGGLGIGLRSRGDRCRHRS
jgi:hypothetical protein